VSIRDGKPEPSWQTGMALHAGEPWDVPADSFYDDDLDVRACTRLVTVKGAQVPAARLRRVGWLDQKGRVWLATPPAAQFDGGSLTPLLIDARED
jgi:hypothetical protein